MRKKPYPLEALRTLRAHAQQAAELELHAARAALDAARAELSALERAHEALRARRRGEHAPRAGVVRGSELARIGDYAYRLRSDYAASAARIDAHTRETRRLARLLRLAELTLQQAYIERQVVERHHAAFTHEVRRQTERALEDEQDDWQAFIRSRR